MPDGLAGANPPTGCRPLPRTSRPVHGRTRTSRGRSATRPSVRRAPGRRRTASTKTRSRPITTTGTSSIASAERRASHVAAGRETRHGQRRREDGGGQDGQDDRACRSAEEPARWPRRNARPAPSPSSTTRRAPSAPIASPTQPGDEDDRERLGRAGDDPPRNGDGDVRRHGQLAVADLHDARRAPRQRDHERDQRGEPDGHDPQRRPAGPDPRRRRVGVRVGLGRDAPDGLGLGDRGHEAAEDDPRHDAGGQERDRTNQVVRRPAEGDVLQQRARRRWPGPPRSAARRSAR